MQLIATEPEGLSVVGCPSHALKPTWHESPWVQVSLPRLPSRGTAAALSAHVVLCVGLL